MAKALVNRILPFSSVDGPGNRMVIFLQGCNFTCLYCHNPETISRCIDCGQCISACPTGALENSKGKVTWDYAGCISCDACISACCNRSSPKAVFLTVEDVMEKVGKVRPFISGITVSGGECTLQEEFLIELFCQVHKSKLTAFVDTNGSIDFSKQEMLTSSMDMAMLDIKSFDEKEHIMLTGMSNDIVIKNAEYLAKLNKLYEIRTVIVPELLNNLHNVKEISRLIADLNPEIRYKLIKYRPIGVIDEMKNIPMPTDKEMLNFKFTAEQNGCKNIIIV